MQEDQREARKCSCSLGQGRFCPGYLREKGQEATRYKRQKANLQKRRHKMWLPVSAGGETEMIQLLQTLLRWRGKRLGMVSVKHT